GDNDRAQHSDVRVSLSFSRTLRRYIPDVLRTDLQSLRRARRERAGRARGRHDRAAAVTRSRRCVRSRRASGVSRDGDRAVTKRLMCVLAHPDDESLGTGGTLAKYAAEGVETYLLTATHGERGRFFGNGHVRPHDVVVGRTREAELRAAAN